MEPEKTLADPVATGERDLERAWRTDLDFDVDTIAELLEDAVRGDELTWEQLAELVIDPKSDRLTVIRDKLISFWERTYDDDGGSGVPW